MYLPSTFRQDDPEQLRACIEQARLALLVSQGDEVPQISHLPLLLVPEEGEQGVLYGHLARANSHLRQLDGRASVAVFQGPDAYVSPSWYASKVEHGKAVPTWNYVAVHAHGRAELFDDPQRLRALLERLTARHEDARPLPWRLEDAPADYLDGMLRGIVGVALPIERLVGKWKLSQNRSAADRQGVREALANSGDAGDRALAARMDD